VQKQLELAHALRHQFWRGWDESGVSGARAADPILTAAEVARLLAAAASLCEQDLVNLPNEPERQRETAAQTRQAVIEGGHVVRHLLNIGEWNPRSLVVFKKQQVRQGRLGSLNLG
jgi:hypothetical protein